MLAAYREAVRLVSSDAPSRERALALAGEARALMLSGQSLESRARCEEALAIARALGERLVEAQVHNTLSGLGWAVGDPAEHAATGRRIAGEIEALEELGPGYVNGSEALEHTGRIRDAIALAEEGVAIASRLGLRDFEVYLTSSLAAWHLRLGHFEVAERLCGQAIPRTGAPAAQRHRTIGMLATTRGEFAEADAALTRAEELARGVGGPEWWPAALGAIAILRLWQGRFGEAADVVQRALDAVDTPGYAPWLPDFADVYPTAARIEADRAELARARGEPPALAEAAASGAVARLDAMLAQLPREHQPPRPLACRALAAAEAGRARARSDPADWQLAAERFRELSEPYTIAYAEYRQAEALPSGHGGAAPMLRDAHATTARLGERPLRSEIEALAQRLRVPLAAREVADPVAELGITAREHEVLGLLAAGRTNRQIAEALVITEKTASVHVSHILRKLDASNRGEAAAIAHRLGLTAR
jgi:DNA-binding CsgD family transcriptional regulator